MSKMDPNVKARWVEALRSGKYRQTREALKDRDGHCCLGVLCDLYAQEDGRKKWDKRHLCDAADGSAAILDGDTAMPRAVVYMWAGLDPVAKVRINGVCQELAVHNDGGVSFAQIADAIEAQL